MNLQTLTPLEFVNVLWKRRWWFLLPCAAGIIGGLAAPELVEPTYRASTLILVEPQKVPTDYVKTTVTTSMEERLKTIEQQITNRENLKRIIEELDLYPDLRPESSMGTIIDTARRNLTVEVTASSVFRVFFKGRDPALVAATANRLADLFIKENLKLRENQARGTSVFLETEQRETKQQLEALEAELAVYKRRHMGQLPEQRETILRTIDQLQSRLSMNNDAIERAELRRLYLQDQQVQDETAQEIRTESKLEAAVRELAELEGRYTGKHPSVALLRDEVARLRARESTPREPQARTDGAVDPTLKLELDAVVLELKLLREERDRILEDSRDNKTRLDNIPRIEQELLALTRDYDNVTRSYGSIIEKLSESRLAENMEKRQQSEQFTILEKAIPPEEPYGPDADLLLAMGIVLGGAVGFGLAFFRELTDQTYMDGASLVAEFPAVPLLATIPNLTPRHQPKGVELRSS